MLGDARESVLSFIVPPAPNDAVFMAAAEKFASWAAVDEINDEHPIKYLTGLTDQADFDQLTTANQRLVLNLAFSAYRFVSRLEEILIESGFSDGAPIPDELNSLVVVMLWELAERRFLLRGTRSKSALGPRIEEVSEVEKHLDKWAVKLAASLARLRIRESSLSLADTMDDTIKQSEADKGHARAYGWVNKFKREIGVDIHEQLELRKIEFKKEENLTKGLLSFDQEDLDRLEESDLIKDKHILMADATSNITAQILNNLTNGGFALSNGEDVFNVLHAGGTFNSVPLIADVVRQAGTTLQKEADQQRFLFGTSDSGQAPSPIDKPKLLVCVPKSKHEEFREKLTSVGISDDLVELLPPLSTLDPQAGLLQSVKICIVEPECSLTLTSDPIQYLLLEGKGADSTDHRLQNISKGLSKPREGMKSVLSAALTLPHCSACVYLTRSSLSAENQETVQSALSSSTHKKGYKLTNIPIELDADQASMTQGKFLRIQKSSGSGFFGAVMTRNQMDPKIALKKAALKGLYIPATKTTKPSTKR